MKKAMQMIRLATKRDLGNLDKALKFAEQFRIEIARAKRKVK